MLDAMLVNPSVIAFIMNSQLDLHLYPFLCEFLSPFAPANLAILFLGG
jgi:hypothetical protein